MAYKLIYNHSLIILEAMCAITLYSKASMQLLLVNNWVVYCGMQAKSVCICTYDGIKVGLLYNNVM